MSQHELPVVCRAFRGGRLESEHRGSWVVLEGDSIVERGGDADSLVYPRSSLKPIQLLPLFASPDFEDLGLDAEARAILVASHSADETHVAAVMRILEAGRATEAALACGPHEPLDRQAAARLHAAGGVVRPIHNNCSGKHAGFLLSARRLGVPLAGYLAPAHPVQREILALIAELTSIPAAELIPGVDGCGAPNWPMPLGAMAAMFRDLANPDRLPARLRAGAERLFDAVQSEPHFLAGRGRFDSALVRAARGCLIGKCGAEGFFAIGIRAGEGRPATGIAIKVSDGAMRGFEYSLPGLLERRGILDRTDPALDTFGPGRIQNTQGLVVGRFVGRWDGDFDPS